MARGNTKYNSATIQVFNNHVVEMDGYVALDASGNVIAPSTTQVTPRLRLPTAGTTLCREGGTWTKTGTGEYTLTLSGAYMRVEFANAEMTFENAVASLQAIVGPNTVSPLVAAGTQTIKVYITANNATKTNPSAPCGFHYFVKLLTSA